MNKAIAQPQEKEPIARLRSLDVDRGKIDTRRDLAQSLSIAAVALQTSPSHTECPDKRSGHDPNIVAGPTRHVRYRQSLRTAFQDDSGPRSSLEDLAQLAGLHSLFVGNRTVGMPDTDLGFLSSQVDCYVIHG